MIVTSGLSPENYNNIMNYNNTFNNIYDTMNLPITIAYHNCFITKNHRSLA